MFSFSESKKYDFQFIVNFTKMSSPTVSFSYIHRFENSLYIMKHGLEVIGRTFSQIGSFIFHKSSQTPCVAVNCLGETS